MNIQWVRIRSEQSPQKLESIPLCNNKVQERIEEIAVDVEEQVTEVLKNSRYFAIPLDDNVSNCAILLYFVRCLGKEDFKDELLCCIDLPGRNTKSKVFRLFHEYLSEKEVDWGNCGVCKHGGPRLKPLDGSILLSFYWKLGYNPSLLILWTTCWGFRFKSCDVS